MKKHSILAVAIGLSLVVLPILALAQDSGTSSQNGRPSFPGQLRPHGELGVRIQENVGARNDLLENRRDGAFGSSTASTTLIVEASSTRPGFPWQGPDGRGPEDFRNGSSTDNGRPIPPGQLKKISDDRRELRVDIFIMQQTHIVKQLTQALDNLKQVRGRIESRITKSEQSGRDMTDAKALLVTADAKLAAAQVALDAFTTFSPSATSTVTITASSTASSTATTTIAKLEKARKVAEDAKKAIKDAKDALENVVDAIAKDMGFKLDN